MTDWSSVMSERGHTTHHDLIRVDDTLRPAMPVFSPCSCLGKDPGGATICRSSHTGVLTAPRDPPDMPRSKDDPAADLSPAEADEAGQKQRGCCSHRRCLQETGSAASPTPASPGTKGEKKCIPSCLRHKRCIKRVG
ncbi:hypothetical protein INR49_012472 [Caranx melampygus]|nr:hypothetical protein INR49_012472 [Caranx melampygus]